MDAAPVCIVVYEGASAFEALGALAALRASGRAADLVAQEALVRSLENARLVPDRLGYEALAPAAAVVVPGGEVKRALADAALAKALRARRGHFTLAAGEGVRVLAAAGLTEERRIARMPGEPDLAGATSVHARLVADGRLLTCFPGDALVDLVLHWVGHQDGAAAGERGAHALGREWKPFAFGQNID
ncbi:MAG TPA: DJ-1/PfpI family protein [Candidatus Thermoplasmatota archaeon]|nr:DJ-1/PfpI family protein [Candidatus Thermoplasmatota archaeon]